MLLVRVSCLLKYRAKETKIISVENSVFQTFLLAHPFRLRKITTDPHILAHVYIQGVPGGMCQTSGGCSLC
jgi:hypothetical protein